MSNGRVRGENARIEYELRQIRFFAGDYPEDATFGFSGQGHSGAGWYVWCADYADEGSGYVGNDADLVKVLKAILAAEATRWHHE